MPGASGLRWMPRKIAGNEMSTIEALIVAINMPSVVLDSDDPLVVRMPEGEIRPGLGVRQRDLGSHRHLY